MPSDWVLDDGVSRLCDHRHKFFSEVSYDSTSRVFRGFIDWRPTSWEGEAWWDYEMVFSPDLEHIMDGQVVYYSADGMKLGDTPFNTASNGQHMSRLWGSSEGPMAEAVGW